MADFKETLRIERLKTHGVPMALPFYRYTRVQEDLADDTMKVIGFSEFATLGECCKLIDDFSPCEKVAKLAIANFLKTDKYYACDEF